VAPPRNLVRASEEEEGGGGGGERQDAQVPVQGGGGVLPAGPTQGGGSGAPGAVQRPQGQGLQPGLLHRAAAPPLTARRRGPQAAKAPAPAHPRHLPQRHRGVLRCRRRRHRAGHPGADPCPRPTHRDRADVPRWRGEVARHDPRGGAHHVVPGHKGPSFLLFRTLISPFFFVEHTGCVGVPS
jgi:hypothetical protein